MFWHGSFKTKSINTVRPFVIEYYGTDLENIRTTFTNVISIADTNLLPITISDGISLKNVEINDLVTSKFLIKNTSGFPLTNLNIKFTNNIDQMVILENN